ncbi:MAG: branched-chain amino acid transport system permease protein [Candidatus Atribacteria bacterium]|jgi:branched-chain amino acid transport system permease protein|uniref:branched-chain amino acid ABC transporter permease n=1 Tax=Atrimonas thermophila TaxID=3064161 RepID=UPI0024AB1D1B|nr:branched-chain amino acid transport system permease protein [Candidatus Atribacteria bacterium]MDI3531224.1 branched-chain amino acid transport system permease protein [Candidatus Atribacteria bacterium]
MFSIGYLAQQSMNGVILGCIYALLALGMTVVYGILRLINFAHGALITLGAFFFYFVFFKAGLPFVATVFLLLGFGGVMGIVLDTVAYRKLRGGPEVALLITSLGFYTFIENFMKMLVSPQPYAFKVPQYLVTLHRTSYLTFRTIDIFIIVASILIMSLFQFFVKYSKMGIAMRATSENLEVAEIMGIEINKVISIAFLIGSAIAAFTGFMWGAKYGQISYDMGFLTGVKAFVAVVVGGVGSIPGAMLGGFILGLAEILSIAFLPTTFAEYRDAIVFAILIMVLLVRPSGIMGIKEEVRA